MKQSTNIAISFILLLLPTIFVGWIGFTQIGNLEKKITSNFNQWAGLALNQARQTCIKENERFIKETINHFKKTAKKDIPNYKNLIPIQNLKGSRYISIVLDSNIKPFGLFPRNNQETIDGPLEWLQQLSTRKNYKNNHNLLKLLKIKTLLDANLLSKEVAQFFLQKVIPKDKTLDLIKFAILLPNTPYDFKLLKAATSGLSGFFEAKPPFLSRIEQEIVLTLAISLLNRTSKAIQNFPPGQAPSIDWGEMAREQILLTSNLVLNNKIYLLPIEAQKLTLKYIDPLLLNLSDKAWLEWFDPIKSKMLDQWDLQWNYQNRYLEVIRPLAPQLKRLRPGEYLSFPTLYKEFKIAILFKIKTNYDDLIYPCIFYDPRLLMESRLNSIETALKEEGIPFKVTLREQGILETHSAPPLTPNTQTKPLSKFTTIQITPLYSLILGVTPEKPKLTYKLQRKNLLLKSLLLIGLSFIAIAGGVLLFKTVKNERHLINLKTSFIERVSHELKTPLSLIQLYSETLANRQIGNQSDVKKFSEIIYKESLRLNSMIENVLNFSKHSHLNLKKKWPLINLKTPTLEVVELFFPQLKKEGFKVKVDCNAEAFARINVEEYKQAIINLISNARKFSLKEKEIAIRTFCKGNFFTLVVEDKGVGLGGEKPENLLKTFYRGTNSSHTRGVGLGLSIVNDFVKNINGTLNIENRATKGVIVTLRIPIDPSD